MYHLLFYFLGHSKCWPEMEVKGEATGLMVQDLNDGRTRDFSLLRKTSRPATGPTQPPYTRVTGEKVTGA